VVDTPYAPAGVIGAGYGLSDRIAAAGELDLDLGVAHHSLAWARAQVALATGTLAASAQASLGYAFSPAGLSEAGLGALVRYKLSDRLALISNEQQAVVTMPAHRVLLRLPVGVAYQLAPTVYGWVSVRIAGSSDRLVAAGIAVVPRDDVDIVAQARAF